MVATGPWRNLQKYRRVDSAIWHRPGGTGAGPAGPSYAGPGRGLYDYRESRIESDWRHFPYYYAFAINP